MRIENKYEEVLSPIKKRVYEYLDFKGIKKSTFFKDTKISSSNFRGKSAKSELGGDKIARILAIYSDLNAHWLLTGEGEMIKTDTWKKLSSQGSSVDEFGMLLPLNEVSTKKIPLVHRYAYSNFLNSYKIGADLELLAQSNWNIEAKGISTNFLAFEHIGESMRDGSRSAIMDGDFILGQQVPERLWSRKINGQNFVILHKSKGIIIRQLHMQIENPKLLNCISRNNNYQNFQINIADILALYKIVKLKRNFRD